MTIDTVLYQNDFHLTATKANGLKLDQKMENPGIDPGTSHMQSERSTT